MNMTLQGKRPAHIEDALIQMHSNQWFTWTDSKNKIYANLKLTDKVGIDGNIVDNPVTELTNRISSQCKIKGAARCMGCSKRRLDGIHRTRFRVWSVSKD